MLQSDHWRDVLALADELAAGLAALRIAAPYIVGTDDAKTVTETVRRLSAALGS